MSDWGGTDAESLKKGIDSIFLNDGKIPVEKYDIKLVTLTTDGASVNTGKISGLMTRFASGRDWLVRIHCINHRVELAVKDALGETKFKDIDDFYQSNFYLLRDSGKIKSELKISSEALGIQHYTLPKMSGTRFIGHRRSTFRTLLNIWPSFIMAYENVVSDKKTRSETKAKVAGLLKKFKNYHYIVLTCVYLDLLEKTVPASKVFEGEGLLPFEVKSSIQTTLADLNDFLDDDYDDIDSHLQRFSVTENDEGKTVISEYNSPLDKNRKLENRKPIKITLPTLTQLNEETVLAVKKIRKNAANELIKTLKERFQSLDEEVFSWMNWCNPENWTDERDDGIDEIRKFAAHFNQPLHEAGYDETKIRQEWRNFRRYVNQNLSGKEPRVLWKNVLLYKRKEFPNICLLAELMYALSGSNSAVERAFSILTMMLSDRRLLTSHDLMNFRIIIKGNDKYWSEKERSEILQRALEIYLTKKTRKRKLDETTIEVPSSESEMEADSDSSDSF
jgi:hypothetical protein